MIAYIISGGVDTSDWTQVTEPYRTLALADHFRVTVNIFVSNGKRKISLL